MERVELDPKGIHWDATGFAVLAMAQHCVGEVEKARAALTSAQQILAEKLPDPSRGRLFEAGNWYDWLHAQVLCRNAEEVLKHGAARCMSD